MNDLNIQLREINVLINVHTFDSEKRTQLFNQKKINIISYNKKTTVFVFFFLTKSLKSASIDKS